MGTRSIQLLVTAIIFFTFSQAGLRASPECVLTGKEKNLFERMLAKNCGQIPYPISALREQLDAAAGVTDSYANSTFFRIPHGRSLVRDKTNFDQPRYLSSFSDENTSTTALFLGFTPHNGQFEAIVWNEKLSRYDFFLIEDYKPGSQPRVVHPPRSACITCHQNGGPIFPRAPWLESEGITRFGSPRLHELLKKYPAPAGAPETSLGDGPFVFDGAVRSAAKALVLRDLCENFCRTAQCRKDLLAMALTSDRLPLEQAKSDSLIRRSDEHLFFMKKYAQEIVNANFARASSVLPDRDPLVNPEKGGTVNVPILPSGEIDLEFYREENTTSEASIKHFLAGMENLGDPKLPRPKVSPYTSKYEFQALNFDLQRAHNICFQVTESDIEKLGLDIQKMRKLLGDGNNVKKLTEGIWPPPRAATLALLRGEPITAEHYREHVEETRGAAQDDASHAGKAGNRRHRATDPMALLNRHCASCHGPGVDSLGSGGRTLPLQSLREMQEYRNGLAHGLMKRNLMPPAEEKVKMTSEEKRILMEALAPERSP